LPRRLLAALSRHGVTEPFPVQAAALPDVLAGENVLGRARTGAGKTLAYGLPTLTRIAEGDPVRPGHPTGLVLVPTRELAQQVHDALLPYAQALRLRLRAVYGGTSIGRQIDSLRRGVHLIVATPGRLTDLLERQACSLDDIRVTVLDEADHMCDLGFLPAVQALLDATPADGQRLLFSATLDREVEVLVARYLPEPVLVAVDPEVSQATALTRHALEAADRAGHMRLVAALTGGSGRTLVFARTQHSTDRLSEQLTRAGVPARPLHGGMTQNARTKALAGFADGTHRVLVATDVAARGIHVDGVDLVVHAALPNDAKTYQHRGGRTARAGASGADVLVHLPEERAKAQALLRAVGCETRTQRADADHPLVAQLAGPPAPAGEPVPKAARVPADIPQPRKPTTASPTSRGAARGSATGAPAGTPMGTARNGTESNRRRGGSWRGDRTHGNRTHGDRTHGDGRRGDRRR
jgi:superfamily II DNA/RNA helicase